MGDAFRPDKANDMIIRVLGCSGAIAAGCKTTAFLLDGDVLIDAGTGVGDLALDELVKVDHILLSHSHLDHVVSVALLADSVMRQREQDKRGPILVHALGETVDALKKHVFNGIIWPDFTRLPSTEQPVLRFVPFKLGEVLLLGARRIEVLPAEHTVPAVGFALHAEQGAWVFTGDTGPNPALWTRLRGLEVRHLVIETAFSDEERTLARISKHLCPATLAQELAQFEGDVDVHITHIKPGEMEAVMAEIAAGGSKHRIKALEAGQELRVG